MRNLLGRYVNRYEKKHRDFRRYAMIAAVLALVVFVGVNWRLHDKGISMTSDYQCGLKEHKHTADCYKKVLICGKEETDGSEGHTHTDACYKEEKKLTCDKEEHKHNADCYDEEGNLICDKEEHTHSEDCYTTEKKLICGKEESKPVKAHHHTDACYKKELVCKLKEHAHTAACYSNENADVEDKSDWEATIPTLSGNWAEDIVSVAESQIGYEESTANFKLADDGETRKGYTRYGDWYGNKYGDWSAMFASFCLNYAGISSKTVPVNSGSTAWITELKQKDLYKTADNHNPTTGDLVFLDTDSDGKADHVGIITGAETKDDVEDSKVTSLTAIVGDSKDAVEENTYKTSSDKVVGYCALPENPDAKDAEATTEEAATAGKAVEKKSAGESTKAEGTTAKTAESKKKTSNKAKKSESKKNATDVSEQAATQNEEKLFEAMTSDTENWITQSDALFLAQKIDNPQSIAVQSADTGIATQTATTTIDFGKYITKATLKKLVGKIWKDSSEFEDGDNVMVRLEYNIPQGTVTADNPTITYQLPDGIKLKDVESGSVKDANSDKEVGTYTITKDGKISITFNEEFLKDDTDFIGDIEFMGTASNDSTNDSKDITFGADGTNFTIKPKPVDEDLTVKKTASEPKDGKVSYTITATSNNGTGENNIKISDSLNFTGLKADEVQIGTITVKDKDGKVVTSYNTSFTDDATHKNFDITDLPPLRPGENYTITYDVIYGKLDGTGKGFSCFNNTVKGFKGAEEKSQSSVYTELSKDMVSKSGYATDNNTKIKWTIKVNPSCSQNVAGTYKLEDILNNEKLDLSTAEDITIVETDTNSDWKQKTYKGSELSTIFKNGELTVKDGCSYEITYKTSVPDGKPGDKFSYSNEIGVDGNGNHYEDKGNVDVVIPTPSSDSYLSKEGRGTQEGSNNTTIANWKATLKLEKFKENKIIYTDKLLDNDGKQNAKVHYTTVKQLKGTLSLSCEISNSNQELTINSDDYILRCYPADGGEPFTVDNETADDIEVIGFEIELTKPINGKNLFITYSTTMNTTKQSENTTLTVNNEGNFNGTTVNASNSYTKVKRLYKYGGKKNPNEREPSYAPGDTTIDYEAQDGKLYYRIIVKPKDTKSFTTVTDTLPEGVTVNPDDVTVKIYYDDSHIRDETWDGNYSMAEHKPEIKVDGQKLELTFAEGFPSGIGFCIDYKATISDSFWDDLKNSDKTYFNTVSWEAKTETQETTVTRHTDVISKAAEQVVGTDGKVTTNRVKYYVTINPAGEKLNEGRNLTLTDTLQAQNVASEIKLGTVKLYSYDYKNKTDH